MVPCAEDIPALHPWLSFHQLHLLTKLPDPNHPSLCHSTDHAMPPQQLLPCGGKGTNETSPSPTAPHSTVLGVAFLSLKEGNRENF